MIMHFDFQNYFRMVRLAWKEENPVSRRRLLVRLLIKVPFAACAHAICFFLDGLLFPGLWRLQVRTPVFIIGHARSGTTLVHRLMSEDGERFSSFMLYELWFPSLLEKKVIRFLARCDRRFLGSRIEKRVRVWEEGKYGKTNKMHPMGLTKPEEDDFVLTASCASGYWNVMLPYMQELDFHYVDDWPVRRRRRLMNYYKQCIKRQLYLNGSNKIHLSKNPTFCGRVESIIETFPDARIVVPMRNPYETIPSLLKLLQRGWQLRRWDEAKINGSLRVLLQSSFHSYTYPDQVLARHPEVPHALIDYRQLVAHPKRTIEQVYNQLGFTMSPEFTATLAREEQQAKTHESAHHYSLDEFGLTSDAIRAPLAALFARYGWDEEKVAANTATVSPG